MTALIVIVHVIVCLALIMIVLLQTGKGADMGAVFGGAGSQTLFGSTGATTFLGKLTTGAAIIFMLTSLTLAYMSKSSDKSVVSDIKTTAPQPVESVPPAPVAPLSDTDEDSTSAATESMTPAADSANPIEVVETPGEPATMTLPVPETDAEATETTNQTDAEQ